MSVEAKVASRRERKEPTSTAYPVDPSRGRRQSESRMDGGLQPTATFRPNLQEA
jgi:hypothetical protein